MGVLAAMMLGIGTGGIVDILFILKLLDIHIARAVKKRLFIRHLNFNCVSHAEKFNFSITNAYDAFSCAMKAQILSGVTQD